MSREKPNFRENLDRLDRRFPDREVLSYDDIAEYFGYSLATAKRHFQKDYSKTLHGISKTTVASALS